MIHGHKKYLQYGVCTAALITSLTAPNVYAADGDRGEDISFEEVVVTGSRIKRKDLTSPSPVAVIGAEEFKLAGTVNVEQVLNQLPQAVPGLTGSSNNPGSGIATVNLRALEAKRTLVLVDGLRYIPGSLDGIVDLNTIPSALIQQVQVVTGGASAVYGSDAMAGVVNFILKDNFEGLEISGQYGSTHKGDGQKWNIDTTLGANFANDRGNAYLHTSFAKRHSVLQGDRKFTAFALGEKGNKLVPGGSATVPQGRINRISFYNVNQTGSNVGGKTFSANTGLGTVFSPDGAAKNFVDPTDRYNYAPGNYLQLPQDRWMVDAGAHYDINEHVTFYTKGTFTSNRVDTQLAATPAWGIPVRINYNQNPYVTDKNRAFFKSIDDNETIVAKDGAGKAIQIQATDANGDPLIKDGKPVMVDQRVRATTAGDGVVNFTYNKRMLEVGPRQSLNTRKGYRILSGFKGDIDSTWSYDVNFQHIVYSRLAAQNGNVSISKMQQAADVITKSGKIQCRDTSNGCQPMNMFGVGSISKEAAKFISIGVQNYTEITNQSAQGIVTGVLGDIGAGEIGVSFGAEWRRSKIEQRTDEFLSSGDVRGFNAGRPTNGSTNSKEIFGEMVVPLISDQQFAKHLEFTGALRYSDYSSSGGVWSYAGGLDWAPTTELTLRGQYQRAVRAPNINELFGGQGQSFPRAKDPCALETASDFCKKVAADALQPNTQIASIVGGNPNLKEETSDTFTIGAVFQPKAIEGLNITVDYFNISIKDAINTLGGGVPGILDICYNQRKDLNDVHCKAITRDPGTKAITQVMALNANTSSFKTAGIDLQLDYSLDLDTGLYDNASTLSLFWLGTYLSKWEQVPYKGAKLEKCIGGYAGNCGDPKPKVKFTTRLAYASGPLTTTLTWRYIGGAKDLDNSVVVPRIGAENYIDLSATYEVNEGFEIFGGVRNLFNNKPTQIGDAQQQANTFPNVYDVLGTYLFFGGKAKF